jgi:predicted ABC-type ATPase
MKKRIIIVGGANGVGKTTFAYQYRDEYGIDYLGADEIAEKINETEEENAEVKAGKLFFKRLDTYLKNNRPVIIESTLSGLGLAKWLEAFKASGYTLHFVYVFLDSPDLCNKRIRARVEKGGHNVPPHDVDRRYLRSLSL